ncbi:MAG TPA: DNA translocase FtsK 4TM domain-containing protein [Parcubacteria group bacterium]|nr:DNA translocase FtsK 4TM domain-containing protein [Parcubacteria group bacterium]
MAKKERKNRKEDVSGSFLSSLSEETRNAIFGVGSLVLTILLSMAAFGVGGPVGGFVYKWLSFLFGVGYYLIPLVFLLLSISFFRAHEKNFALPQTIGSILFFFSALGVVGVLLPTKGGIIGYWVAKPLLSLFAVYLSLIILIALIVVSLLVIFDTSIKVDLMKWTKKLLMFKEKENTDTLLPVENVAIKEAVDKLGTNETDNKPEVEPVIKNFNTKKKDEMDGFAPITLKSSGKAWTPPPLSLLERDKGKPGVGDIKANANIIKRTLQNFGIIVEMDEISIGPSVTRYALKPAEGVKLSKILGLQTNLELALAAHPVRIEAPIPGKSLVGIEVPNSAKTTIGLGSLLSEREYAESQKPLLVALGKDVAGESHFANIAKMPHALIAGATGSGKSVTIHAIVTSLLYRNPPENMKFIMIDPKRVELTLYNKIPHLLTPVITDAKKAILALKWATKEMERRYEILEKESVRDIDSFHQSMKEGESMPFIVIIIDELADLMQAYPRELEAAIVRLAQMSRAVGIHLLLSTQRPSVNIITGLIKANVPSRVALQVASQIDSRTILDAPGAEKLLGAGDMLWLSGERGKPTRLQSAYISETEVKKVVKYLVDNYADELTEEINFSNENTSNAIFSATLDSDPSDDDELYEEAREIVTQTGKASTSFLQRKLRIGYARAARLIDILEEKGVVGPGSGAKPREVIGVSSDGGAEGFGQDEE